MEIKNIIRERRLELGLTYEELGKMVGVGKSTVRKWETGMIENIKRDNIVALAKALNVSPALIMGWDVTNTLDKKIENNNRITDTLSSVHALSQEETTLLENYNKLDNEDKNKVIDYTKLLHNQDKYRNLDNTSNEILDTNDDNEDDEFTKSRKQALEARRKAEQYFKENPHLMPIASHDKDGEFTEEDYKHDDDIMKNDDLWK